MAGGKEEEEEEEGVKVKVRVGCAFPLKNQRSFLKPSLIEHARSKGVILHLIDPTRPIAEQGTFHIILHKLSGDQWKARLSEFCTANPNTIVLDPPAATERLHNRVSMLQAVSEIRLPDPSCRQTFGIPKQKVLASHHVLPEELQFPVLAKPLVANGSDDSHAMSLVFNAVSLEKLSAAPVMLQEFVNHGGVLFKVYVVGEYVHCVCRNSLPDVDQKNTLLRTADMPFRLTRVSSGIVEPEVKSTDNNELPPVKFVQGLAKGLREALGLNLFNFDLIREKRAPNHYDIIDINYFPAFAKLPDYETVFVDFFLNLAQAT